MTETEKRNGEWTTISVRKSTLTELAELMPKSWEWDRCISELKEMWKNSQGKVIRTGKSTQNTSSS